MKHIVKGVRVDVYHIEWHEYLYSEEGFTFDSVTNTMIPYYIPGEQRRMRLDRILQANLGTFVS